jgi:hypothetical protein
MMTQAEHQVRQDEDAVLAQALQTLDEVLEQHTEAEAAPQRAPASIARTPGYTWLPLPAADGAGHGQVPAAATPEPAGRSTDSPLEQPIPQAPTPEDASGRGARIFGAAALVTALALFVIAMIVGRTPGPVATSHITATGGWILGGAFLSLFTGMGCLSTYTDEAGGEPGDTYWGM